jgi:hypothetical protein
MGIPLRSKEFGDVWTKESPEGIVGADITGFVAKFNVKGVTKEIGTIGSLR